MVGLNAKRNFAPIVDLWRDIVDSLNDAVVVLSENLEPIAVNAAAETILDASRVSAPLVRRLMRRNEWLSHMAVSCLKSGQSLDNPEATFALKHRSILVSAEVSPLTNSEGKIDGVVILFHDLSHQKGIEHPVGSDQNALRLSPAGLAHEVKNPLTGIKGAAELLAAMFPSDPRARQYCSLIQDGVNRIAGLVEQVLAVSSSHRLKREPVNIHRVLHQALQIAGLFPEPPEGIVVQQAFDPSLPEVTGDEAALERVFLNLIRNAVEAIEGARSAIHATRAAFASPTADEQAHHDVISLRTAMESQLRLNSQGRRQRFLRVEISDSGKGMNHEELNQLFTPFFTTKPSGTGLGLVLSQHVISLHGGKLWAQRGYLNPQAQFKIGPFISVRPGQDRGDSDDAIDSDEAAEAKVNSRNVRGMTFCVTLPVTVE